MLCVTTLIGFSLAVVPRAFASAQSLAWSGLSTTSEDWSSTANWEGGSAPTLFQAIGTLRFPRLTSRVCLNEEGTSPCYISYNDVSGLSAEAIDIDDADDYLLGGESVALGAGGLTAAPATRADAGDFIETPLQLTAEQKWSIAGSPGSEVGENGLFLAAPVTGTGKALTIQLSEGPALYLANDTEAGPVTITGQNTGEAGVFNGVASLVEGELNSTNGQPVTLSDIFFIGDGAVGALQTNDTELYVGSEVEPNHALHATSVKLDPASEVTFEVTGTGAAAGEDYSQLLSNGTIALESSKIVVRVAPPHKGQPCPVLPAGRAYTFVSTSATLSGEFANAPEHGVEIPIKFAKACTQRSQQLRISYHESGSTETVTGTVEAAANESREATEAQERKEAGERQEANEQQEVKARQKAQEQLEARRAQEAQEAAATKESEEAAAKKTHEEEAAAAAAANAGSQGVESFQNSVTPAVPDARLANTALQASASDTLILKVSCPSTESTCTGTVTLRTLNAVIAATAKAKPSLLTLATGSFTIAGGKTSAVLLHLSRKARALLKLTHMIRVRVTIVAHDPAGATHTTQTIAVLHPPKSKHP
jgi:hypothetical protein